MLPDHGGATVFAKGAKEALEAAALVDSDPAPIIAAAERLHKNLALLGADAGIDIAADFGAAEAIDAVTDLVGDFSRIARHNAGLEAAYQRLHELLARLRTDFAAAGSETAKRIADRIESAMDDAAEAMKTTGQEA